MPQNSGESDLIWLFLTLETPTREKLMQGYPRVIAHTLGIQWVTPVLQR